MVRLLVGASSGDKAVSPDNIVCGAEAIKFELSEGALKVRESRMFGGVGEALNSWMPQVRVPDVPSGGPKAPLPLSLATHFVL